MISLIANTRSFVIALQKVSPLARSGVIPITENVKIVHSGTLVSVTTTDLQTCMTVTFQAENEAKTEQSVCVLCKDLLDLLKAVKDQAVVCKIEDERGKFFTVASKKGAYTLGTAPVADYPEPAFSKSENKYAAEIPTVVLRSGIEKTLFAVAESTATNMAITGVFLEVDENRFSFAATNGSKLSHFEILVGAVQGVKKAQGLIPAAAGKELLKALADVEESVYVTVSDSHLFVETQRMEFSCRFLDARFPGFRAVTPKRTEAILQIEAAEMVESLSRLKVVTTEENRVVNLDLDDDTLRISAEAKEFNKKGRDTIDLMAGYTGKPIQINLNAVMLSDILTAIGGDVRFYFTDHATAVRIEPAVSVEGETHVAILTPYTKNT